MLNFKLLNSLSVLILLLATIVIVPDLAKAKDETVDKNTYTVAVIDTEKGVIKAVLFTEKAPITTKNFIDLANKGFYKNMIFHRVEKDFVIQTGDPTGTGEGGSGKYIPLEVHKSLKHNKPGMLGMARKLNPDSATSQFYITLKEIPKLDAKYAVFGQVYDNLDVIYKINKDDKLNSITIINVPKKDIKLKK